MESFKYFPWREVLVLYCDQPGCIESYRPMVGQIEKLNAKSFTDYVSMTWRRAAPLGWITRHNSYKGMSDPKIYCPLHAPEHPSVALERQERSWSTHKRRRDASRQKN